jgi:hypothetical protein
MSQNHYSEYLQLLLQQLRLTLLFLHALTQLFGGHTMALARGLRILYILLIRVMNFSQKAF